MFARTERLLLRPGWAEDAPALAKAIADEMIVRNLSSAPWPFSLRDAEAHLAAPRDPLLPSLLIFERTTSEPLLVGSCGLGRRASGSVEFGYWIARPHWGQGFATEAGQAVVSMARAPWSSMQARRGCRRRSLTRRYWRDSDRATTARDDCRKSRATARLRRCTVSSC